MHEVIQLVRLECEDLLRAGVFGRAAFTGAGDLHVIPMNYAVADNAIIVRTEPGGLLAQHGPGTRMLFEIDQVDHAAWRGWSVAARGVGELVTSAEEIKRIDRVWRPRPWAAGSRSTYVRMPWDELHGRRLGTGWSLRDSMPVRRSVRFDADG